MKYGGGGPCVTIQEYSFTLGVDLIVKYRLTALQAPCTASLANAFILHPAMLLDWRLGMAIRPR